jgi:hypothetical protein
MKAIEQLTNVEKANLLHQLFPSEIPAFIAFVTGMAASIKEDEEQQRAQWDNGFLSFDFWLNQVEHVEEKIRRYDSRLHTSNRLFSEQLFDGYLAMYMNHCLVVYTTVKEHPNKRFAKAVDLFINP